MGARYAEVVVNTSLRRGTQVIRVYPEEPAQGSLDPLSPVFHYAIPPSLQHCLTAGHMVQVPFGPRVLQGIVVGLTDRSPVGETREIGALLDPEPVLSPAQIELGRWMSRHYLAPLRDGLLQMLPPGLARQAQCVVERVAGVSAPDSLSETQRVVLTALDRRGPQRWPTLRQAIGAMDGEEALETLVRQGLVLRRWVLPPPRVQAKTVSLLALAASQDAVAAGLSSLGRPSRLADVLEALADGDDPLPSLESIMQRTAASREALRALEKRGWVVVLPARELVETALTPLAVERALVADLRRAPRQAEILRYLRDQSGPVEVAELRGALHAASPALRSLERRGVIRRWQEQAKVILQLDPETARREALGLRGAQPSAAILRYLAEKGVSPVDELCREAGARVRHVRELLDRGLVRLEEREVWRDPLAGQEFVLTAPPRLTSEQEASWRVMQGGLRALFRGDSSLPRPLVYLLFGVTGSGKTELYLHALQETLAAGRQAIVLVPEIALTPQTIRRFAARFPNRIAVWHSALSDGERYDAWRRIRAGQVDIVIGPRSACFVPLPQLGCIIVDEEHEPAYKQEIVPCYHTREVVLQRAGLEGAALILGSATPDLGTYHRALQGQFTCLRLPQRVLGHRVSIEQGRSRYAIAPDRVRLREAGPGYEELRYLELPSVEVVDLRAELRAGNHSIFSRALQEALAQTLEQGQQAILFLNRRGTATFVLCRDCGWVLKCPRCDVPLTYHLHTLGEAPSRGLLVCHHCGRREKTADRCPNCAGPRLRYFGVGTERVEQALRERFPDARIVRWDRDTTGGAASHDLFLEQFVSHRADVLVGTQMVAKGLDLPLVTLVGVISADIGLHLPDFRAGERTFQLLTQVAGRAGRSILGGKVIIQTYSPKHYAIRAASQHDYEGFYSREIAFRREQGYPPWTRLARLVYRHRQEAQCAAEVQRLADLLRLETRRQGLAGVTLIGPAPCFFHRLQGRYRWQIVVRAADPTELLRPFRLPVGWQVDVDPIGML